MLTPLEKKYFKEALAFTGTAPKSENENEIVARCPVCGDSKKSQRKARLHLYSKNNLNLVNCFNGDCPVKNLRLNTFLRQFYPEIYEKYRREYFATNLTLSDTLEIKPDRQQAIKLITQDLSPYFEPIETSPALEYVKRRGITYKPEYKWFYSKDNLQIGNTLYKTANSVIIPLYDAQSQMFGFYSRNIEQKTFATYLRKENTGFKVWNFFNIDPNKEVYIFEGIFDALSAIESGLPNSIACLGATLSPQVLSMLKKPVFCYDNDSTGIKNLINAAKENEKYGILVLPDIQYKDINEMLLSGIDIKKIILYNIRYSFNAAILLQQKL